MLSFDEARARILASARVLGKERVPVREAFGRVLSGDLVARASLPRFDASAMDGYAVALEDLGEADDDFPASDQFSLRVEGESRAGGFSGSLTQRTACRIFTGAALPVRANAVVMQENVRRDGNGIFFDTRPKLWQHVRRVGEDMKRGDLALPKGTRLSAGALALAAMLDCAEVECAYRPRVTILSTGDELRAPGSPDIFGTIPESNSPPIAALALQAGATVIIAPIARDDQRETENAIKDALQHCDLLVTIGGVSVGDHDVVKAALESAGVAIDFWRVAIKPGKPLAVGKSATAHVLGLPGNPASAMVTFALFGMPLLRAMQGDTKPTPMLLPAKLATSRARVPDRMEVARIALEAQNGALLARPLTNQASGAATTLAESDGVMLLPQGEGTCNAGERVDVVRWIDL